MLWRSEAATEDRDLPAGASRDHGFFPRQRGRRVEASSLRETIPDNGQGRRFVDAIMCRVTEFGSIGTLLTVL